MAGWKTLALNRVELLEDDLRTITHGGVTAADELKKGLGRVRSEHGLADDGPKSRRVPSFGAGDERNHAWDEIHRLETSIEGLRPSVDEVVESARAHADQRLTRERRKRFEDDLKKRGDDAGKRSLALRVIHEAHEASAAKHEAERQQLRGILVLAVLLLVGAVVTVILQWRVFPASPLVTPPADTDGLASWAVVSLVMMFGMLGGGFSALMALYVTNKTYTDTYWFDPRPGLAFMKVSVGVWAAFFGVLAVGSGLVVGTYTGLASLVLLSFLFGYGQQAITGLLDKKVEGIVPK